MSNLTVQPIRRLTLGMTVHISTAGNFEVHNTAGNVMPSESRRMQ